VNKPQSPMKSLKIN